MTDLQRWLPLIGAILAAGMWLGSLESRVKTLETLQRYEHGTFQMPKENQ